MFLSTNEVKLNRLISTVFCFEVDSGLNTIVLLISLPICSFMLTDVPYLLSFSTIIALIVILDLVYLLLVKNSKLYCLISPAAKVVSSYSCSPVAKTSSGIFIFILISSAIPCPVFWIANCTLAVLPTFICPLTLENLKSTTSSLGGIKDWVAIWKLKGSPSKPFPSNILILKSASRFTIF